MKVSRTQLISALVGFVFGALWLVVMRALFVIPDPIHYHANFAVFVKGQRELFEGFGYYEEVQACTQDDAVDPHGRVHLHQPNNDVVHVHTPAATWGNLFENLGLGLSNDAVTTSQGTFVAGSGGELTFVLNGERTTSIANRVVGDTDRLLVSFGDPDVSPGEYEQVANSAAEFNSKSDPAACSGSSSSGLVDRFRRALLD